MGCDKIHWTGLNRHVIYLMGVASGKIFSGTLFPIKHPLLRNPSYATDVIVFSRHSRVEM